eukprot:scaffold317_cov260-Pinguiococcus_pyrenoidosus.AAC.19
MKLLNRLTSQKGRRRSAEGALRPPKSREKLARDAMSRRVGNAERERPNIWARMCVALQAGVADLGTSWRLVSRDGVVLSRAPLLIWCFPSWGSDPANQEGATDARLGSGA